MLITELFFVMTGIALLVLAFWLGEGASSGVVGRTTPVPSTASINHALKLQNSLNELLRELQSLSQEVTNDLEEKLGQLKDLLQIADMKYEALSAPDDGNDGNGEPEYQFAERKPPLEPQNSELELTIEDDEAPPMPSARYRQIYQLADDGCSLDEIARHLRMGKGEIQLILSLRKKD
jgi:hypothetical protein